MFLCNIVIWLWVTLHVSFSVFCFISCHYGSLFGANIVWSAVYLGFSMDKLPPGDAGPRKGDEGVVLPGSVPGRVLRPLRIFTSTGCVGCL